MSLERPSPERPSQSFKLIETDQRQPKLFETPYGPGAFICHKGTRPEQQDVLAMTGKQVPEIIAAVDGITLSEEGKEAGLMLATVLQKLLPGGNLADIAKDGQATMQTFGLKEGGAVFAALELSKQRVSWVGDVRIAVIYPDNTPPFTTRDHVDPDKRNHLLRQIGASHADQPEVAFIDPPLYPGCIVVLMTDGAYKNFELSPDADHDTELYFEGTQEEQDAQILATLLKPHATPEQAVRALNERIATNPRHPDNVTLAVIYIDKKIPLTTSVQEG